ncbi:MAG TPA: Ig-like domain-containing protein, partial [Longimicrobium sp.]|nr:Ig-like domain-containing protein [Longimicrobium sp.]
MISMRTSGLARAGLLLGALALGACSDGGEPVAPTPAPETGPVELVQLSCTVNVKSPSVRCGGGLTGDARGLVVGNQGTYVQLTSGTPSYNAGTGAFSFPVTVQNLIPQAMGTTNGTTASGTGVRILFAQNPAATGGTGTITFTPDGTGTFTAANQSYFQYSGALLGADGILSTNETSGAKTWTFTVPATVTSFNFTLFVAADVPRPDGYIDVTPGAPRVLAGSGQSLAATVRSAVGNPIAGQTITWGTSSSAVATVDASGTVTAVAPGTATITATAGTRTGTATISVCPNLAVGGTYVVTSGTFCLGTGAGASEYTVVPVSLTQSSIGYTYIMTPSGIVPVSGAPTPDLIPAPRAGARGVPKGRRADEGRHLAMLREQRRQAAKLGRPSLVRNAAQPGLRRAITPGVPAVGAVMN